MGKYQIQLATCMNGIAKIIIFYSLRWVSPGANLSVAPSAMKSSPLVADDFSRLTDHVTKTSPIDPPGKKIDEVFLNQLTFLPLW